MNPSHTLIPVRPPDLPLDAAAAAVVAAAAERHVLVVGNPGTLGALRGARAVAAAMRPDAATRWEIGVLHYAASGGFYQSAWEAERRRYDLPRPRRGFEPRIPAGAPFRAPHHTVSIAGMCGTSTRLTIGRDGRRLQPHELADAASIDRPGELSLAHGGVLLMDEAPEWRRDAAVSIRWALDHGSVEICRGGRVVTLPARFRLIAAAYPCPCGMDGHADRACTDSIASVARYRERIRWLAERPDVTVLDHRQDRSEPLWWRPVHCGGCGRPVPPDYVRRDGGRSVGACCYRGPA